MSVLKEYLARQAAKAALKKIRREKWADRFHSWWQYLVAKSSYAINRVRSEARKAKQKLKAPAQAPATSVTAPPTNPTPSDSKDSAKRFAKGPWIYFMAAVVMFGLGVMVLGIYVLQYPGMLKMQLPSMGLLVFIGLIATVLAIFAYFAYRNRWATAKAPVPPVAAATTTATTAPVTAATTATTATRAPAWPTFVKVMGGILVVGLVFLGGYMGVKLATSNSRPAKVRVAAIEASTISNEVTRSGDYDILLLPGQPVRIVVPPMHRWDAIDPIPDPDTWTMPPRRKDSQGNLIRTFEIMAPAKLVILKVRVRKCTDIQDCS